MQINSWQIILGGILLFLVWYFGYLLWIKQNKTKKEEGVMALFFGLVLGVKAISDIGEINSFDGEAMGLIVTEFLPAFLLIIAGIYYFRKKV